MDPETPIDTCTLTLIDMIFTQQAAAQAQLGDID
jgi:hypothetical protein